MAKLALKEAQKDFKKMPQQMAGDTKSIIALLKENIKACWIERKVYCA